MPERDEGRPDAARLPLPRGREPHAGETIGGTQEEALGVFLTPAAADALGRHVAASPRSGAGGILVGHAAQAKRPFVLICGAIGGEYTGKAGGSVSFTDRTWQYMTAAWQQEFPGTWLVGWFCSHPDDGAVLTSYDRFTHHRFFQHPWQVVLSIDPIGNTSLFYRWAGDQLAPLRSFMVWDPEKEPLTQLIEVRRLPTFPASSPTKHNQGVPLSLGTPAPNPPTPQAAAAFSEVATATERSPVRRRHRLAWLAWPVLVLILAMLFWPGFPWSVTHLWSSTRQRQAELEALQRQLDQTLQKPAETTGTIAPGSDMAAPEPSAALGGPAPGAAAGGEVDASPPVTYRVRPGDTLWHISEQLLGDPFQYPRLADANDLENPSLIYPGTYLSIPHPASGEPAPRP